MWRVVCVCCLCCVWLCAWSWLWHVWCSGVYQQHAHVLKQVCACCQHTRGRFESRHGGRFERTGSSPPSPNTHRTNPKKKHQSNITRRQTEKDRERDRDKEKTEKERRLKKREKRRGEGGREEEREKRKNSVLTCTRGGMHMLVSLCCAHFLTRKRNLEHVNSMIHLFLLLVAVASNFYRFQALPLLLWKVKGSEQHLSCNARVPDCIFS